MALQGDFRMVATGTPLENHLGELWNLFRFINPGLLGTSDQFNLRFAGPIERAQDKRAEAGARTRLRRLIQPFILRRTKAQVLAELPPRTEIVLPVDLTAGRNRAVRIAAPRRARKAGRAGGAGKPEVDPDPGRDDEAAARLLQSAAGGARAGPGQQQAGGVRAPARRPAGEPPQGAGVQPVRRPPDADPPAPRRARHPLPVPRRLDADDGAQEAGRRLPGRRGRRLPHQPEGGRGRHQPDRGRLRDPHGPVVESGGRGPGVRPRAPHGAAAAGDDLPAGGAPHHRGRHRRPAQAQARPGRQPARRIRPVGAHVARRHAQDAAGRPANDRPR